MTDPTYALGRSAAEHQRLLEQASFLRPLTERLFRAAGVVAGMRVLDVGSGVGDVAFLLAELVGPTGEVIGVDLDHEALSRARERAAVQGLRNVHFFEGDFRTINLDGDFDAAAGRLVLLYLADPSEGVRAVASRVRSGGPIVFQEMDMNIDAPSHSYPTSDSLWSATGRAIIETFAAAGVRVRIGRELIEIFLTAGLPQPAVLDEAVAGGGADFAGYSWITNTMRSLAPLAAKLGVKRAMALDLESLADRIRDEAVARHLMVWSPPYVGAYARKPAAAD
jgi:ubiquinone/menaquinone biosynthesis C-methylase UbiE